MLHALRSYSVLWIYAPKFVKIEKTKPFKSREKAEEESLFCRDKCVFFLAILRIIKFSITLIVLDVRSIT